MTVKVAHVRLCHSRMLFVRAYPRETQGWCSTPMIGRSPALRIIEWRNERLAGATARESRPPKLVWDVTQC